MYSLYGLAGWVVMLPVLATSRITMETWLALRLISKATGDDNSISPNNSRISARMSWANVVAC